MNSRRMVLVLASALAGCAVYQAEPLTINHPAHPQATAAPARPASRTLAYTSTDIPSQRQIAASEQGGHEEHHQPQAGVRQTVVGEGKVVAVVPSNSQVVVEHGEIKDFMGPMTMGYPTAPPSLLEGLSVGDKIRFTIDVQKKTIVKIEKLNK
jgi:Cu(I)/Ag(I) efflux system periplasmic protein CusF